LKTNRRPHLSQAQPARRLPPQPPKNLNRRKWTLQPKKLWHLKLKLNPLNQ
jgi:hypothetical protein